MESVGFRIRNHDDILDYGPHKGVVDHDEAVRDGGDLAQELGGGAAQVEGGGIKGRLEVGGKFGGGVGVWERTEKVRGLELVEMYVGVREWVPTVHADL